jgi:beta-lactamase class A
VLALMSWSVRVAGAGHGRRTGRHWTGAPAVRGKAALAAVSACLVIAAVILITLAIRGPDSRLPAPGAAAKTGHASPARQPKATSPAPARRRHQDPLAAAAASYVSTRAGTVLAAVYDIATGQTWRLGQGQPQAEASVVKLDVLETLLAEQGDSRTGLPATDRSLAQQMIEDSDNAAATSLWYDVGGAASIRSFNAAAGLTHTSPSPCVDCPRFPWPGWGLTTTTPTDQISLLRELVEPNALLTSAERSYALSLMENVTPSQRWGISGGVPTQATVALKNGWLPLDSTGTDWQINSVGWISAQRADYLMAVFTTGNPTEQYGIDTINGLAAIVWNDMS